MCFGHCQETMMLGGGGLDSTLSVVAVLHYTTLTLRNNWATSATLYFWPCTTADIGETFVHTSCGYTSSAAHLAPLLSPSCKQFNLFLFKTNLIATLQTQTLCSSSSSRKGKKKVYTSATSASGRRKLCFSVRLHC